MPVFRSQCIDLKRLRQFCRTHQQADFRFGFFGRNAAERTAVEYLPVGNRPYAAQSGFKLVVLGGERTDRYAVTVGQGMEREFVLDAAVVIDELADAETVGRHGRRGKLAA